MKIIVDNREKTPWHMAPCQVQSGTLTTGDYGVVGCPDVVIERKSLPDLVMCCGAERERFVAEIKRLMAYRVRAVVVEAEWSDIYAGKWRSKLLPQHVIGSVTSWIARGVPFIMGGAKAGEVARDILYMAARQQWLNLYKMHEQMHGGTE